MNDSTSERKTQPGSQKKQIQPCPFFTDSLSKTHTTLVHTQTHTRSNTHIHTQTDTNNDLLHLTHTLHCLLNHKPPSVAGVFTLPLCYISEGNVELSFKQWKSYTFTQYII